MYKVVIIDDEPEIIEGLLNSMPWNKWNCEVIGSANDGVEGIKLIKAKKPDIILTDIKMPNMDGLKMIAVMKVAFPNIQITILSRCRDFDYVCQAMQLGVTRYLLKPFDIDKLSEAMDAMTNKLSKSCNENKTEDKLDYSSAASSFIVNNALNYIKQNYSMKLRLVDVADQIYVSQWHLSKMLNKYTGKNFSDILNGIRVEKAKELLKDCSLKICDIAEEVGFLEMSHFSRVFKKYEGMSAGEYRNRLNKNQ